MQKLECKACNSPVPLHAPRLLGGRWQALCGECLTINRLEPESANVFLPLRFQVTGIVSEHRPAGALLQVPARAV